MNVQFVNAEVLTVGPDEVLIIRFPEKADEYTDQIFDALEALGLAERTLVFGGEVELSKVKKDDRRSPP